MSLILACSFAFFLAAKAQTALSCGDEVEGTISAGSTLSYTFSVDYTQTVIFDLCDSDFDVEITINDNSSSLHDYNDDSDQCGTNSLYSYLATVLSPADGEYTIEVSGFFSTSAGDFEMVMTCPEADGTTLSLNVSTTTAFGVCLTSDCDRYCLAALDITQNGDNTVDITGAGDSFSSTCSCKTYNGTVSTYGTTLTFGNYTLTSSSTDNSIQVDSTECLSSFYYNVAESALLGIIPNNDEIGDNNDATIVISEDDASIWASGYPTGCDLTCLSEMTVTTTDNVMYLESTSTDSSCTCPKAVLGFGSIMSAAGYFDDGSYIYFVTRVGSNIGTVLTIDSTTYSGVFEISEGDMLGSGCGSLSSTFAFMISAVFGVLAMTQ